jgi:hypothetical protein
MLNDYQYYKLIISQIVTVLNTSVEKDFASEVINWSSVEHENFLPY